MTEELGEPEHLVVAEGESVDVFQSADSAESHEAGKKLIDEMNTASGPIVPDSTESTNTVLEL